MLSTCDACEFICWKKHAKTDRQKFVQTDIDIIRYCREALEININKEHFQISIKNNPAIRAWAW